MPRVHLEISKKTYTALHAAIRKGLVRACHDLSEGGLAVAAAEMAIAGGLGLSVRLDRVPAPEGERHNPLTLLFSESPSRFLVEVVPENQAAFEALMAGVPCACVGEVTQEPALVLASQPGSPPLLQESVADLKQAWQGAFK